MQEPTTTNAPAAPVEEQTFTVTLTRHQLTCAQMALGNWLMDEGYKLNPKTRETVKATEKVMLEAEKQAL